MSISFKEIVENVLLEGGSYADPKVALNDTDSWISKVQNKVGDLSKIWGTLFSTTCGRYFAKKNINEYYITLQDLMRSLALQKDIKPERSPVILDTMLYINKVQEQYEIPGSTVRNVIDEWLTRDLQDLDDYIFLSGDVNREWVNFKKDLKMIENAAFDQHKSSCIYPAIIKVIDYKTKNKQGLLSGVVSRVTGGVGTFQGLVEDIFTSVNDYVIGARREKKLNWSIIDATKTLMNKALGTSTLSQFERTVESTRAVDIIRFAIVCRSLFDNIVQSYIQTKVDGFTGYKLVTLNELKTNTPKADIDNTDTDEEVTDITKDVFLQFIKTGNLNNFAVVVIDSNNNHSGIPFEDNKIYTLQIIETLNTDQSRQVISQFKELCTFINTSKSDRVEQFSNALGGLNQAAGVKL